MEFAGINYGAVITAAVVAFVFGAGYYGALADPWMRAARRRPEEANMSLALFATTFASQLLMAWAIAGVIGHLGAGQITLRNGVVSGFFVWLGFMAPVTLINQRYEGYGLTLSLIDGAHWLGVALLMGAVVGWWGV